MTRKVSVIDGMTVRVEFVFLRRSGRETFLIREGEEGELEER